jgi:hypothetical protein
MLIRPCQYIHTALLIYPYGTGKIFIRPCHTDQLDYLIKVLWTGCFCIGPGIDSRSAVLALAPTGLGANTAHLESIPGPIQKQPVSNNILWKESLNSDGNKFHQYYQNEQSLFMLIELAIAEHKKRPQHMTFGNPNPSMVQVQTFGRVNPVTGTPTLHSMYLNTHK